MIGKYLFLIGVKDGEFMELRKVLLWCILCGGFFLTSCGKQILMKAEVAKWKNNAQAAYTIIHDDLGDSSCIGIAHNADTIAYNRGLKIAAGVIVQYCNAHEKDGMWDNVRRMASHGHEIVCHSWDHGAALDLGWTPLAWSHDTDVVIAKKTIEEKVPGVSVDFFIYPFDAYNDQRLAELRKAGYLGARVGDKMYEDRGLNTEFENFNPFKNCRFDAYYRKAEQDLIDTLPENERYNVSIYNDDNDDVDIQHLNAGLKEGAWCIQEMHSVASKEPWGWGHIKVENYRRLLDYAQKLVKENKIWMDGPTSVIKYIMTKKYCKSVVIKKNSIDFVMDEKADKRYATELSLMVTVDKSVQNIVGKQGKKELVVKKVQDGLFLLSVNPFDGHVSLLSAQ